jgi:Tfp pilus assembly protein PilP
MMRFPRLAITPSLRLATACAALALVTDVALLARASTHDEVPRIAALRIATVSSITPRTKDAPGLIEAARARQPFSPGSDAATPPVTDTQAAAAAIPIAQPRLVGTVTGNTRSFVVVAVPDGSIKVVHVGQRAGELTLRSVAADSAVFENTTGDRVTLRSPKPGAEPHP